MISHAPTVLPQLCFFTTVVSVHSRWQSGLRFFQCCSCKSRLWEWNLVLSLSCTTAVNRASADDAAWRVVSDGHARTYSRCLFQDYSKQMECAALIINRAENTLTADTSNETPIWLSHCHPFTYSANDAVTCCIHSWIDRGVFLLVLFVCFKIYSFKTFKLLEWILSVFWVAWLKRKGGDEGFRCLWTEKGENPKLGKGHWRRQSNLSS